jgi:hypothetical protein
MQTSALLTYDIWATHTPKQHAKHCVWVMVMRIRQSRMRARRWRIDSLPYTDIMRHRSPLMLQGMLQGEGCGGSLQPGVLQGLITVAATSRIVSEQLT